MRRYYPEHRPGFLFSRSERLAHPTITLEAGQAILVERFAMQAELAQCRRKIAAFSKQSSANRSSMSERAETTFLNVIGAMLELMLGQSPGGIAYSNFKTQAAVVSALIAHHNGKMGISERTLNGKFAKAKQVLNSTIV